MDVCRQWPGMALAYPHSLTNPSHKSASSLAHPFLLFGLALLSRVHSYICNKCCSYSLWLNQTHLILMLIKCKQKSILHKKCFSQKAAEVELRWILTILIFFYDFSQILSFKNDTIIVQLLSCLRNFMAADLLPQLKMYCT